MPWHSPGGNPWPIGFAPIVVSEADRREPERVPRSPSAPAGFSRRARTVLLMAQGLAGVEIAERTGYTVVQVSRLRRRFAGGQHCWTQSDCASGICVGGVCQ